MNLFYEYGLNSNILDLCVCNANVHFRQGFKKFLKGLYDNNIPVIILSAGIGNVIYNLLRINDCLYDNIDIVSNFIDFSDDGNMLKYNKFMIHSCNKSLECANNACNSTFRKKKHALLFGDLIEDLSMIPKKDLDKCLCFGFLDKMVDTNFEFYMDAFDVVLTDNGSFEDVIMVLNKFKKS